ncbi:MAG: hypothetical protein IJ364_05470 [Oscillospiraceae bacterium]|nr:hypothetical protein [Oscillospiraceae bacterium]
MLDNRKLFDAIGLADDEFIEEARQALKYGEKTKTVSIGRVWKVALIAAVLAALLAITGFASEWFGLSRRTTPSNQIVKTVEGEKQRSYISMNGYADSPEAMAHKEWTEFRMEYILSHVFSNETDTSWTANEEEKNYYFIYGAFNREMMDKLLEIQAKYNIRLHTEQSGVPIRDMIYEVSGAEPFFTCDESAFFPKVVYEDGSFTGEGHVVIDGIRCGFSLIRGAQGVLDPSGNSVLDAEDHTEWQYTNKNGDTVNLAMRFFESNAETLGFYLFTQQGDYIVTILGSCPNVEDLKASAERFADCFDMEALCAGSSDLRPVLDTKPTNIKPKEGLMTLKEFVETPEYKAAAEFYEFYSDYCDALPINDIYVEDFAGYHYNGSFPSGVEAVDAELSRIIDEYKLVSPGKALRYSGDCERSATVIKPDGSNERTEAIRQVSEDEYFETMGFGRFSKDALPSNMLKYDNGAIWLQEAFGTGYYLVHYIPKGCFYPMLMSFHSTDVTSWAYETACGEQVWISTGENPPYPKIPQSSILYETDTAYVLITKEDGQNEAYLLEAVADNIDFTMFN